MSIHEVLDLEYGKVIVEMVGDYRLRAYKECSITGKPYEVDNIPIGLYEEFRDSGDIEDIFPDMLSQDKDFLLKGITPDERRLQND